MSELWRGFTGWPLDAAVLHAGLRAEVPAAAVFALRGVVPLLGTESAVSPDAAGAAMDA